MKKLLHMVRNEYRTSACTTMLLISTSNHTWNKLVFKNCARKSQNRKGKEEHLHGLSTSTDNMLVMCSINSRKWKVTKYFYSNTML